MTAGRSRARCRHGPAAVYLRAELQRVTGANFSS